MPASDAPENQRTHDNHNSLNSLRCLASSTNRMLQVLVMSRPVSLAREALIFLSDGKSQRPAMGQRRVCQFAVHTYAHGDVFDGTTSRHELILRPTHHPSWHPLTGFTGLFVRAGPGLKFR